MKKFFVSALAVVAMASCSQNEIIVDSGKPTPIHFKPQFGNSVISRADPTLDQNITLGVYAYNGVSPAIYDNITNLPLAYNTDGWYLTPKEHYYPQDDSNVSFWAYGPQDHSNLSVIDCSATNGPSFTLTLANTDTDVDIIATKSAKVGTKSTASTPIIFELKHVLAQVKFMAKVNTQANAQAFDVKIYSVTIKTKGEASYTSSAWGSHTGNDVTWTVIGAEGSVLSENATTLGNSVNVIPEQTTEIEVKAKVYKKNENVVIADQTATLTLDGGGGGGGAFLAQGTCYTYTISVTPNVGQIVFGDPTLTDFTPSTGDVNVQ